MTDSRLCPEGATERIPTQTDGADHIMWPVIDAYTAHLNYRSLSPETIRRREWTLRHWADHLSPDGFELATGQQVEAWLSQYPTASTRKALLCDLRSLYRWGLRRGVFDTDPTADIDTPKIRRRQPTPVLANDVHRLIGSTTGHTRTAVMLGAYAGFRVAEMSRLTSGDVDWHGGELHVRGGKGDKDRTVPLAASLALELVGGPDGLVLGGMRPDTISSRIKRAMRALGIERRPHDLRASFATEVARQTNGNAYIVRELLGHSSITTSQWYVLVALDDTSFMRRLYTRQPAA